MRLYSEQDRIKKGFEYIFQDTINILCERSTQYLIKWIVSCQLAMKKDKDRLVKEGSTEREKRFSDREWGTRESRQVDPYSPSYVT